MMSKNKTLCIFHDNEQNKSLCIFDEIFSVLYVLLWPFNIFLSLSYQKELYFPCLSAIFMSTEWELGVYFNHTKKSMIVDCYWQIPFQDFFSKYTVVLVGLCKVNQSHVYFLTCYGLVTLWHHMSLSSLVLTMTSHWGWQNITTWWCHQIETFFMLLAICAGNSLVPVNSPHKGQWRGALMFSLICARINCWVNNHEAGDLRCRHAHYDVIVMNHFADGIGFLMWKLLHIYSNFTEFGANHSVNTPALFPIKTWPVMRKMFPFDDVIMQTGNKSLSQTTVA